MHRVLNIIGQYAVDEHGKVQEQHDFSTAERDELLSDAEKKEKIVAGFQELSEPVRRAFLQNIRPANRIILREANIALTKQAIRDSTKPDSLIVHTINGIEELDKVCNTLVKRLREWYALYDPELEHAYKDHRAFVEAILRRTSDRTPDTMGATFADADLATVLEQAKAVENLYAERDKLLVYLERVMSEHTRNLMTVASATIGAKLLAMAGSLERLSRMPSSTIQLLGAETALFRHLRNKKARPPKHGIIFNHLLMQRAPKPMRGKVARTLADKISIASKIDYFHGEFIGDKLFKEVEARLKQ